MHEYDTVLKTLLRGAPNSVFQQITGLSNVEWLNVELPEVQQTRVDLLGVSVSGDHRLVHLELQGTNDPNMALRMAEYSLRVFRLYNQFPEQFVLYVGEPEMRMPSELVGPNHACLYTLLDIRTLDSESLIDSPFPADTVLAILTELKDRSEAIRRILARIATLEAGARDLAFSKLLILAGLRKLGDSIRKEVR
jgi:hypothetical protein